MNELRPYQLDLIDGVKQAYRDGFKAPCVVLGCEKNKQEVKDEKISRLDWKTLWAALSFKTTAK